MSSKKLSNKKKIVILVIIFTLIFTVNLYDFIKNINIRNQGNIINAYVYDIHTGGRYGSTRSYVKYNIDNIEYNSSVFHNGTIGKYIPVYYNINNHEKITTDGEISKGVFTIGLIIVTFLSMLIIIVKNNRKK